MQCSASSGERREIGHKASCTRTQGVLVESFVLTQIGRKRHVGRRVLPRKDDRIAAHGLRQPLPSRLASSVGLDELGHLCRYLRLQVEVDEAIGARLGCSIRRNGEA